MNPQKLEACPGFIGCDAPSGPGKLGRVVIDPARVVEAYQWLRRRFDVREELELCRELDGGLCVTIMARPPRKLGVKWRESSGFSKTQAILARLMKRGPKVGFKGNAFERFWRKVRVIESGCWLWTASTTKGYGRFCPGNRAKAVQAHVWAYENYVGPIPDGLQLDHTCRNRACVNPLHLEPVTHRVNLMRGFGASAINARKTHCLRGHPLHGSNVYLTSRGWRQCLICKNIRRAQNFERPGCKC